MAIKLNPRAFAFAVARIRAGAVDLADDYQLAPAEAKQLAGARGRYYLGEDPHYEPEDDNRFRYPTGKLDSDDPLDFTVYRAALVAIREAAQDIDTIFDAAGELLGMIEAAIAEAADDGDGDGEGAGDDPTAVDQDEPDDPKPPEQPPNVDEITPPPDPGEPSVGGGKALAGDVVLREVAAGFAEIKSQLREIAGYLAEIADELRTDDRVEPDDEIEPPE